jgi:hypothetical protein
MAPGYEATPPAITELEQSNTILSMYSVQVIDKNWSRKNDSLAFSTWHRSPLILSCANLLRFNAVLLLACSVKKPAPERLTNPDNLKREVLKHNILRFNQQTCWPRRLPGRGNNGCSPLRTALYGAIQTCNGEVYGEAFRQLTVPRSSLRGALSDPESSRLGSNAQLLGHVY